MTDEKNPYAEMTEDVMKTHLTQLKEVVDSKKIDVTQVFGEPITDADKEKLEKVDTLTSEVKTLSEKASKEDLTENEQVLAQANIDRTVSDIRKIDKDAPLDKVLNSKLNNLQKLGVLNATQEMVQHYTSQIATIRTELAPPADGSGAQGVQQTFSTPPTKSSAEEIIKSMIPQEKK